MYGITIDKEVSVETSLSRQGAEEKRIWDVRFIREFNDWEMDEGLNFLHILGANTPPMDVGDRMRWKLKLNGDFDIRSYYNKGQSLATKSIVTLGYKLTQYLFIEGEF